MPQFQARNLDAGTFFANVHRAHGMSWKLNDFRTKVAVMAGGKIFISYRRADSQWAAARIYDTLAAAFPDDHLFMDVEEIAPGQDFVDVLAHQVGACDVFLALIGPDWVTLEVEGGGRRLDDPDDFVRIEIASALARPETLTIPVLLDGAAPLLILNVLFGP